MQVKKYPHAVLENYSLILVQLGLVLSLFIVYEFLQIKSYPGEVKELKGTLVKVDDNEQIIDFKPLEIEVKQPTQVLIPEKILKVDDEEDVALPIWAGILPIETKLGAPITAANAAGIAVPSHIAN